MSETFKIIFSDFHVGAGSRLPNGTTNYLENFFYENEFVECIEYYCQGQWAKRTGEIILNGDFFEHLEVIPGESDADLLTEQRCMWRQRKIAEGHAQMFAAFRRFNAMPGRRITFNLGNHDPGLLWPGVAEILSELIGGDVRVMLTPYEFNGVRVEHGHRYQADSAFNEKRYFLSKGLKEPIINMPWGCYFVIHYVNKVRKDRPYVARIHPMRYFMRWAFINETMFAIKHSFLMLYYFISLRFVHSKRRRSSFWRTVQLVKESAIDSNLDTAAKKILLTNPGVRILVMGHSHGARYRYYAPDKLYMNTGSWTERLSLDPANLGRLVRLTYGLIRIDGSGHAQAELKEWLGRRELIHDINWA